MNPIITYAQLALWIRTNVTPNRPSGFSAEDAAINFVCLKWAEEMVETYKSSDFAELLQAGIGPVTPADVTEYFSEAVANAQLDKLSEVEIRAEQNAELREFFNLDKEI